MNKYREVISIPRMAGIEQSLVKVLFDDCKRSLDFTLTIIITHDEGLSLEC